MLFRQLFDAESSTFTYLIADETTQSAVLVDPVLEQVDRDRALVAELGLTLRCCLETGVHRDRSSGSDKLRELTGCKIIVPEGSDGVEADRQIRHGDAIRFNKFQIQAISIQGHTTSHMAYLIIDVPTGTMRLLAGDALSTQGCDQTDLHGGDACHSNAAVTERLSTLPDETLVYPGHNCKGYTVSTIGEEKQRAAGGADRDRAGSNCDRAFTELFCQQHRVEHHHLLAVA